MQVGALRFVEAYLDICSRIVYEINRDIFMLLSFFLCHESGCLSSLVVDGLELDICSGQLMRFHEHTTSVLSGGSRNEELAMTDRR